MLNFTNNNKNEFNKETNFCWKKRSTKYLLELEAFLDKSSQIKDEKLQKEIIYQMLKCDNELSLLAEKIFDEKYNEGINFGKATNNIK